MIDIIDVRKASADVIYERLDSRKKIELPGVLTVVQSIVDSVKEKGDKALVEFTEKFDGVRLSPGDIKVTDEEIKLAYMNFDQKLLATIKKAKANIESFHMLQREKSWFTTGENGTIMGQLYRPLETVGVYVPGGTAPLPSSVLMNVIPAKVAGVRKVIMCTPPGRDGRIHPAILVAAHEAGVSRIYKVGGAQAIAAMAFGTATVPRVDKITGPGNIYVSTAKRLVFGYCDIDMFAGPSEIAVIADRTADPAFVAADLLSQAEHDTRASALLITDSEELAAEVQKELERQTGYLKRKDIIEKSLKDYSAIVITKGMEEAVSIVNSIAPEHLEICVEAPFNLLDAIKNAGAIFLGNYSSEPLGDYMAGPNHVLPTSGTARFFSPLNVGDFMKKSSVISYTERALENIKDDIIRFAEAEGLTAHANAIKVRFER